MMTCHGYELTIVLLGLFTGISEILALLKGVRCNGIVDFIIRMITALRQDADVEMPTLNVPLPLPIRRSYEKPSEP